MHGLGMEDGIGVLWYSMETTQHIPIVKHNSVEIFMSVLIHSGTSTEKRRNTENTFKNIEIYQKLLIFFAGSTLFETVLAFYKHIIMNTQRRSDSPTMNKPPANSQ